MKNGRTKQSDSINKFTDMNKKELPTRKIQRLEKRDYASCGGYFVTICTSERRNYFWKDVSSIVDCPQNIDLSQCGQIVEDAINNISIVYPAVAIDEYAIMPDHVHLLVRIRADEYGRPMVAPDLSRVVKQLKGYVSKRIGTSIWQKSFFDHVIRNRADYNEHLKYIYDNPFRWFCKN